MNPNPKPIRERLKRNSVAWRVRVVEMLERDAYTCQACYKTLGPQYAAPHHIKSVGAGGGDELENLITLCKECHFKEHSHRNVIKN